MGGGVFGVVFGLELSRGLGSEEEGGREDGNARSWRARCLVHFVCVKVRCERLEWEAFREVGFGWIGFRGRLNSLVEEWEIRLGVARVQKSTSSQEPSSNVTVPERVEAEGRVNWVGRGFGMAEEVGIGSGV